jgi:hypothetical protein
VRGTRGKYNPPRWPLALRATTINAAAFAPKALRRAAPKLVVDRIERRRELAELAEKTLFRGFCVFCV